MGLAGHLPTVEAGRLLRDGPAMQHWPACPFKTKKQATRRAPTAQGRPERDLAARLMGTCSGQAQADRRQSPAVQR